MSPAEGEWLLAHALGVPRRELHARRDEPLGVEMQSIYDQLCTRRERGEPLAYILGEWEFWSLPLKVTPAVLVPRPETELLVEWALQLDASRIRIADLGTGSGAIAVALASELPDAEIIATDISPAALDIARHNIAMLSLRNVHCFQEDFSATLDARLRGHAVCGLILSNPPYIALGDAHLPDLKHEPAAALISGADGLDALHTIITKALPCLVPGGWLLVEHGFNQAAAVRDLFARAGFAHIETRRDLPGHERATGGCNA